MSGRNGTRVQPDARYKALAREYRESAGRVKRCIEKTTREIELAGSDFARVAQLDERLKILDGMYRSTSDIGREAYHYYEKGWWRSEIYTTNTR